jgi:leader peptidase (prepilin peptidase) / N-methyltransferase
MMEEGVGLGPTPALRALAALLGGPLAMVAIAVFGFDLEGLIAAFFVVVLVALALIDLEERRIPNAIVLPATAVVLVAQLVRDPDGIVEYLVAAVLAALFFLVPALIYRGGIGMGDVKLALLLGAALGWNVGLALLVGTIGAAIPSAYVLLTRGAEGRKTAIPFGPFLGAGAIVALFVGDSLRVF